MSFAVAYLHSKGVYHRSLHPRNIMLEQHPQRPCEKDVRIIDFFRAEPLAESDPDCHAKKVRNRPPSWLRNQLLTLARSN